MADCRALCVGRDVWRSCRHRNAYDDGFVDIRAPGRLFPDLLRRYSLFVPTLRLPALPPAFDTVVGLLSGFFGGILAFPSVLVVIWTGCKGIDRHAQRAIYQPFILLMQSVAISALMIVALAIREFAFRLHGPALHARRIAWYLDRTSPVQRVTEIQFKAGIGAADLFGYRAAVLIGEWCIPKRQAFAEAPSS